MVSSLQKQKQGGGLTENRGAQVSRRGWVCCEYCGTRKIFYCCKKMFFLLEALSRDEPCSSLMTMLAKGGTGFGRLVRAGAVGPALRSLLLRGPSAGFLSGWSVGSVGSFCGRARAISCH